MSPTKPFTLLNCKSNSHAVFSIVLSMEEDERIDVNIRGIKYVLSLAGLKRAPNSRLTQDYLVSGDEHLTGGNITTGIRTYSNPSPTTMRRACCIFPLLLLVDG